MTDTNDDEPETFQVQVSGQWGAFTAYLPHLDLEVEAGTFERFLGDRKDPNAGAFRLSAGELNAFLRTAGA